MQPRNVNDDAAARRRGGHPGPTRPGPHSGAGVARPRMDLALARSSACRGCAAANGDGRSGGLISARIGLSERISQAVLRPDKLRVLERSRVPGAARRDIRQPASSRMRTKTSAPFRSEITVSQSGLLPTVEIDWFIETLILTGCIANNRGSEPWHRYVSELFWRRTTHVWTACIADSAAFTALPHAQIHHNPQKDQLCNYTRNHSSAPR